MISPIQAAGTFSSQASPGLQVCFSPQWGHCALLSMSGSALNVTSSISIPVANFRAVVGHVSISIPIGSSPYATGFGPRAFMSFAQALAEPTRCG
jgi:hypothetical protein